MKSFVIDNEIEAIRLTDLVVGQAKGDIIEFSILGLARHIF
ncbi:MAG: hypothetical protein RJB13_666, partial [Pseudomonadota bacterium]